MAELISKVGYSFPDSGKSDLSLLAILRTFLASVECLFSSPILLFSLQVIFRVIENLTF
jgi:hypothetical protein